MADLNATSPDADPGGVTRTTGWDMTRWVAELDRRECEHLTHADIALHARDLMPDTVTNPEWWAQTVTVAYERHHGRRSVGQSADGTYVAQVSKTIHAPLEETATWWADYRANDTPVNGVRREGPATASATDKWRYWRASLVDGTKIVVTMGHTPRGGTNLAVQHSGLPSDQARQQWRTWWRHDLVHFAEHITR